MQEPSLKRYNPQPFKALNPTTCRRLPREFRSGANEIVKEARPADVVLGLGLRV